MKHALFLVLLAASSSCTKHPTSDEMVITEPSGAVVIDLAPEGKLSAPAGAKLLKEIPPPPNLVRALGYELKPGFMVIINVGKPDGATCKARLETELATAQNVAKDHPEMAQLIRLRTVEARKVGTHDAMYSEAESRSADEARENKPFHLGVSYLLCSKTAFVNLAFMRTPGQISDEDRAMAAKIAESLN